MRDTFERCHPVVNFLFFALVIVFSMLLNHPAAQFISLFCAVFYLIRAEGGKSISLLLKFCLPIVLLTAFVNPAFNHEGATVLLYFGNGNPLTLESILYGVSAGVMFASVILWFSSFSRVMTSDKFICLFGRIIPALSLVLTMSLRLVPKFKKQLESVADAQRCIGRDVSEGTFWHRFKTAAVILSITVTWALENAIDTADSMKSRGWGLKGRTAYTIYRLDARDKYLLLWFGFCGILLISGVILNIFDFRFFPTVRYTPFDMTAVLFYGAYFGLCITPVILNFAEERKWKTILSKM